MKNPQKLLFLSSSNNIRVKLRIKQTLNCRWTLQLSLSHGVIGYQITERIKRKILNGNSKTQNVPIFRFYFVLLGFF